MSTLTLTPRPRVTDRLATLPVAIIGAGPVGLAAAAHLADRGIAFTVLEAASGPAAAVEKWGHTRLFSPWREVVDPVARRLLEAPVGPCRRRVAPPRAASSSTPTCARSPNCPRSRCTSATARA